MPDATRTDAFGMRPPTRAAVFVPVVVAFLVQVPPTIAISAWSRVAPPWAVTSVLLAAASAVALLGARRWPGPTVAAVSALVGVDLFVPPAAGPPAISLAFAIVGAVVRGARLWALLSVGAAGIVALTVAGLRGIEWNPFRIAATLLVLALCFAIGEGVRTRIDRAARRRELLSERRRVAEQDERTRIARELHDVLAHSLSQISVQSGVGLHLFDREPERAREALANIRGLAATGLDEVRGVLAFLRGDDAADVRTAPLTPQPQLAELAALVAQRSGLGLTVTLDDRLTGDRPPGAVQTTAYRVVQEALTNVVRHSAATAALVRLERDGADLTVTVQDDGIGIGTGEDGGGLRGMRERAELAGGRVDVGTVSAEGGTRVVARLPWEGPS